MKTKLPALKMLEIITVNSKTAYLLYEFLNTLDYMFVELDGSDCPFCYGRHLRL